MQTTTSIDVNRQTKTVGLSVVVYACGTPENVIEIGYARGFATSEGIEAVMCCDLLVQDFDCTIKEMAANVGRR